MSDPAALGFWEPQPFGERMGFQTSSGVQVVLRNQPEPVPPEEDPRWTDFGLSAAD